ncbi:MAG TPA: hypothetical protein VFJ58_13970 [Armatimonadota bacterium]|nr:hypothetical protein [Armatimonadota bacterium]
MPRIGPGRAYWAQLSAPTAFTYYYGGFPYTLPQHDPVSHLLAPATPGASWNLIGPPTAGSVQWNLNTFRVRYPDPNNGQPLTISLLEATTPGAVPGFPASSYPNGLVDNHVFDENSQVISSGGYLSSGAGYWIEAYTECELLWPSS